MRIVCLSAEAAEICARLGAWDDVVAVSAFAAQDALPTRPVIGGFSTADVERVAGLKPDLVIGFSDVQADLAAALIRESCAVLITNQRSLAGIADAIKLIGGAIGRTEAAEALAGSFLKALAAEAQALPQQRPRVYFEEWPEPLVSGIGWVGELIEQCGGEDVFAQRRGGAARERTVEPSAVIARNPDIILASWCGRRVDLAAIQARPGFAAIAAVRAGQLYALDSDDFLQPGPRVLNGARKLRRIFAEWAERACNPPSSRPR